MIKALGLILFLTLTSCTGNQLQGSTTLLDAEKALTVANYAYQGVGTTLKTLADTNVLRGQNAANAKIYYDKAGDALLAAKKADEAANAQGIFAQVQLATEAIAQTDAVIHPKP